MGPEAKIQKKVTDYAKKHGVVAMKMQAGRYGSNGWPDYFYFYKRFVAIIEFKAPKGEATPLQLERHEELLCQGFKVWVCDDVELGKHIIERLITQGDLNGMAPTQVPTQRRKVHHRKGVRRAVSRARTR